MLDTKIKQTYPPLNVLDEMFQIDCFRWDISDGMFQMRGFR